MGLGKRFGIIQTHAIFGSVYLAKLMPARWVEWVDILQTPVKRMKDTFYNNTSNHCHLSCNQHCKNCTHPEKHLICHPQNPHHLNGHHPHLGLLFWPPLPDLELWWTQVQLTTKGGFCAGVVKDVVEEGEGGEVIGGRRVEISDPLGNGAGWQRGRKWWMRGEGREIVAGRRRSTEAADGRSRVGRGESLMGRAGILISKWGEEQRVRYSYVAIKHCMMYWGLGVVYLKLP